MQSDGALAFLSNNQLNQWLVDGVIISPDPMFVDKAFFCQGLKVFNGGDTANIERLHNKLNVGVGVEKQVVEQFRAHRT